MAVFDNNEFIATLMRHSHKRLLFIVLLSIFAGIIGGLIAPLIIITSRQMFSGENFFIFFFIMLFVSSLFIFSKHFSFSQTIILTEDTLEKLILTTAQRLRNSELRDIEVLDLSDIYLRIVDARMVSDMAMKAQDIFQNLISIFVVFLYIFAISPQSAVVILAFTLFGVLSYEVLQKLQKSDLEMETEKQGEVYDIFKHILQGFKEIKINPRKNTDLFDNYLKPLVFSLRDIRKETSMKFAWFYRLMNICQALLLGTLVFIIFPSYASSEITIAVTISLFYLLSITWSLFSTIPQIVNGQEAIDRIYQLSYIGDNDNDCQLCQSYEEIKGFKQIDFEKVCFSYGKETDFFLGPINLTIRPGEILIVRGGNGSGKSSLMKVLCGLYPPSSGVIRIDNQRVVMTDFRHFFSTVFSDYHLFDALYGIESVDEEKVHSLLSDFDLINKTQLVKGRRFSNLKLSSGQQKRLALVAALFENKPIFIFDEWTADQDPEFRKYFYNHLLPQLKSEGKSVIAVTHDDRYFHMADRIIKMEYGRIIEEQEL